MNCCNEYGQCTQGKDCPVRQSQTPESDDSELMYLVSIAMAVVGASAAFGFVVGFSVQKFF